MSRTKKDLGFDKAGVKRVMRKRDYMADMGGQFALGLMGNLVGQLTYFYTDKVGLGCGRRRADDADFQGCGRTDGHLGREHN